MTTFFCDCEFDGHNGPLLSIALVTEDGKSFYYVATHRLGDVKDPWVQKNVVPIMDIDHEITTDLNVHLESGDIDVGQAIRNFIGSDASPTFISDSSADIQRLCRILTTGSDGNYRYSGYKEINFLVKNVDAYPTTLPDCIQHNAWYDAFALRQKLMEN